jgi:hypothetical protein
MSKALIIPGANFEENRVKQIVFNDVPCTGVAFESDVINVQSVTIPLAVSVVKTPANTTDELVFSIADTSVAKIVEGGVVAVGYGQTTITATCGSATATATVKVNSIEFDAYKKAGNRIQVISSWGEENPIKMAAVASYDAYVAEKETAVTVPDSILSGTGCAVIRIPSGTNKIRVESEETNFGISLRYTTTDSTLSYAGVYYAKYISSADKAVAHTSDNYIEFSDIPSGADSFAFEKEASNYGMKIVFIKEA